MGAELVIAIVLAAVIAAAFVQAVVARRGAAKRPGSRLAERERAIAAQVEVEEHDIDEMIEARNERRRRAGKPSIGEELAEQARPRPPTDD